MYVQTLLGNGDGNFTPSYSIQEIGRHDGPNFVADVTGDGRDDFLEIDGYTASFNAVPAAPGQALQIHLSPYRVIGSHGRARVSFNIPSNSDLPPVSMDRSVNVPNAKMIAVAKIRLNFFMTSPPIAQDE